VFDVIVGVVYVLLLPEVVCKSIPPVAAEYHLTAVAVADGTALAVNEKLPDPQADEDVGEMLTRLYPPWVTNSGKLNGCPEPKQFAITTPPITILSDALQLPGAINVPEPIKEIEDPAGSLKS
jgi:hypothetical protein